MSAGYAASLASAFGEMNLFARSLGGISSDVMFNKFGFKGRIWAQFLAIVAACVGAGGNLGAGFCFHKLIDDPLLPLQIHAAYVVFWTLLSPCYYWKEYGGMFAGPAEVTEEK